MITHFDGLGQEIENQVGRQGLCCSNGLNELRNSSGLCFPDDSTCWNSVMVLAILRASSLLGSCARFISGANGGLSRGE